MRTSFAWHYSNTATHHVKTAFPQHKSSLGDQFKTLYPPTGDLSLRSGSTQQGRLTRKRCTPERKQNTPCPEPTRHNSWVPCCHTKPRVKNVEHLWHSRRHWASPTLLREDPQWTDIREEPTFLTSPSTLSMPTSDYVPPDNHNSPPRQADPADTNNRSTTTPLRRSTCPRKPNRRLIESPNWP